MVSKARSMAVISSRSRSFSSITCWRAATWSLQKARRSSFFSSSHWRRCCSSISEEQSAERFSSSSISCCCSRMDASDFNRAAFSRINSSIRLFKAPMALSEMELSPRCLAKISRISPALNSSSFWHRFPFIIRRMPKRRNKGAGTAARMASWDAGKASSGRIPAKLHPDTAAKTAAAAKQRAASTVRERFAEAALAVLYSP